MSSPGGFYRRRLPHWQPDGAPLFITWRLVGSLPHAPVGASSAAEAGRAFVRLDRQLDAAVTGPLWLKDPRIASLVAGSFSCAERELGLCEFRAWVLMPNHVHVVVYPSAPLWRITKALKGFSGKQANRILGRAGQPFWQPESFDHWIRNCDELERIVRYVEGNPVTAGLARTVAEWPWSSASVG